MTVTVDQIKTEFPEFAHTDSALIGFRLAEAERLVDLGFGVQRDDAVKYLTCHLVALMPHGEPARLVESQEPGGATTTYERQYIAIKHAVVQAQMVL